MAITEEEYQNIAAIVAQASKKKVESWRDLEVWAPAGDVFEVGRQLSGAPASKAGPADEIYGMWYDDVVRLYTIHHPPVFLDMLSPFYLTGSVANFFGEMAVAGDSDVGKMQKDYNEFLKKFVPKEDMEFGGRPYGPTEVVPYAQIYLGGLSGPYRPYSSERNGSASSPSYFARNPYLARILSEEAEDGTHSSYQNIVVNHIPNLDEVRKYY